MGGGMKAEKLKERTDEIVSIVVSSIKTARRSK
jgi:hypothetical protein